MRIDISASKTINEIQEEFHGLFPYLKLEFFKRPHKSGTASPKNLIHDHRQTLAECGVSVENGSIAIIPGMSVNELEQHFLNQFGLSVQVFRKSGNVWLETSVTDKWSLEKQNLQGRELSRFREEDKSTTDYMDWQDQA